MSTIKATPVVSIILIALRLLQGLALGLKVEVMQRVRVLEALQLLAVNRAGSGRRRHRQQRQAAGQSQA